MDQENQFKRNEQVMIEKIKARQKKEIAQMLNNEFRIEAIKKKAEVKEFKMVQKEEMRRRLVHVKSLEAIEKQKQMDQKLKMKERMDKEKIKQLERKAEMKERAFQSKMKEKELARMGVIESNEGDRLEKKKRLADIVRQFQKQLIVTGIEKRKDLETKDHKRRVLISANYEKRRTENEQKRALYEQKRIQVRNFEQQKIEMARSQFEEKEMNIAMKQEEAKRHEEMRIAEEQKKKLQREAIHRYNLAQNEVSKADKTVQYIHKMKKDTQSVQSQLLQTQKNLDPKLAPQLEKIVTGNMRRVQSAKITVNDELTNIMDERAEYVRQMALLQQKQRGIEEDEKTLAVKQNQVWVKQKRQLLLQNNIMKMEQSNAKLEQREQERERVLEIRSQMLRAAAIEKEQLIQQFANRQKKNNVDLHTLAGLYGIGKQRGIRFQKKKEEKFQETSQDNHGKIQGRLIIVLSSQNDG